MLFLESGLYFTRVIGLMMALSTAEKGVRGWVCIGLGHNGSSLLCETVPYNESSLGKVSVRVISAIHTDYKY